MSSTGMIYIDEYLSNNLNKNNASYSNNLWTLSNRIPLLNPLLLSPLNSEWGIGVILENINIIKKVKVRLYKIKESSTLYSETLFGFDTEEKSFTSKILKNIINPYDFGKEYNLIFSNTFNQTFNPFKYNYKINYSLGIVNLENYNQPYVDVECYVYIGILGVNTSQVSVGSSYIDKFKNIPCNVTSGEFSLATSQKLDYIISDGWFYCSVSGLSFNIANGYDVLTSNDLDNKIFDYIFTRNSNNFICDVSSTTSKLVLNENNNVFTGLIFNSNNIQNNAYISKIIYLNVITSTGNYIAKISTINALNSIPNRIIEINIISFGTITGTIQNCNLIIPLKRDELQLNDDLRFKGNTYYELDTEDKITLIAK